MVQKEKKKYFYMLFLLDHWMSLFYDIQLNLFLLRDYVLSTFLGFKNLEKKLTWNY